MRIIVSPRYNAEHLIFSGEKTMIGKKRLDSHPAICAVFILILIIMHAVPLAAQATGNDPNTAISGPASFSINPDRIAPNYPIPYGPSMIKARRAGVAPDVQPMIDNYIQ